jgi:hypothetical protein
VARPDLVGVDEQAVRPALDVAEHPVVAVAWLQVPPQVHGGARGQELLQLRRRLGPVALDRAAGRDGLGRVDADEADGEGRAGEVDLECVAVDDPHDPGVAGGAASRPAVSGRGQDDERECGGGRRAEDRAEGAQNQGHLSLP